MTQLLERTPIAYSAKQLRISIKRHSTIGNGVNQQSTIESAIRNSPLTDKFGTASADME
jgi:hypothetical protein